MFSMLQTKNMLNQVGSNDNQLNKEIKTVYVFRSSTQVCAYSEYGVNFQQNVVLWPQWIFNFFLHIEQIISHFKQGRLKLCQNKIDLETSPVFFRWNKDQIQQKRRFSSEHFKISQRRKHVQYFQIISICVLLMSLLFDTERTHILIYNT